MFGSLLGIATDALKIVVAPIEIAVDAARVITKPVADLAEEAAKEVKQTTKEIIK